MDQCVPTSGSGQTKRRVILTNINQNVKTCVGRLYEKYPYFIRIIIFEIYILADVQRLF